MMCVFCYYEIKIFETDLSAKLKLQGKVSSGLYNNTIINSEMFWKVYFETFENIRDAPIWKLSDTNDR